MPGNIGIEVLLTFVAKLYQKIYDLIKKPFWIAVILNFSVFRSNYRDWQKKLQKSWFQRIMGGGDPHTCWTIIDMPNITIFYGRPYWILAWE